jgi:putative ABC transport system permease protein
MFKSFYTAVIYAVENIRTNFFHTLLSVIGITIGVSALIIILSMIDGLEKYAEDQISSTTAIKVVEISSRTTESLDGITVRKEQPVILTEQIHRELISNIDVPFTTYRVSEAARQVSAGDQQIGAQIYFSDPGYADYYILEFGTHLFEAESNPGERQVAVVSSLLAERISGELFEAEKLIGTELTVNDMQYEIIGIVRGIAQNPEILIPIDYLTGQELLNHPPFIAIQADEIADVPKVRDAVQEWLASSAYTTDDVRILSQDSRVNQATQGFMLFRIIMGLIVGISVIVGGIGVMNVLLISVTQRTNEIGLRKAVGSRKSDIYVQFLSESMVISLFGTVVGIIIGILASLAVVPIVHQIVEIPFSPAFSLLTITVITIFSLLIGVLFGTYPAYKASQLSPIDALRRE